MLRYNLVKRSNPRDASQAAKFYASPTTRGLIDMRFISEDIAGSSSLSRGDISNVIMGFMDRLPIYLLNGYSVELGELCKMRVVFSSEGVETESAFHTSKIRDLKIYFLAGPHLK